MATTMRTSSCETRVSGAVGARRNETLLSCRKETRNWLHGRMPASVAVRPRSLRSAAPLDWPTIVTMNVFVINAGSSSLKFQVIATDLERIRQRSG